MNSEPVTVRHVVIDDRDVEAVITVLRSGDLSGNSDAVTRYEQALASYYSTAHAVACSSGTAAIHLALLAVGTGTSDEVIVVATAPPMTALAVVATGATPVFVDTGHSNTFAIGLDDLDRRRTPRTRAVISVPMWGYPADGDDLASYCRHHGIALIEDAAQAHGTTAPSGYLAGTQGEIGAFSTHTRKLVCTGEGGFCLTNDTKLATRMRQARNLGRPEGGAFGTTFGLNYKLAATAAALGTSQLARLDQRIATRRAIWEQLRTIFANHSQLTPFPVPEGGSVNGYAFLATATPQTARRLTEQLRDRLIIPDTLTYRYAPTYTAPFFAASKADCPNTEALCRSLIALPCHEAVPERLYHITDALAQVDS